MVKLDIFNHVELVINPSYKILQNMPGMKSTLVTWLSCGVEVYKQVQYAPSFLPVHKILTIPAFPFSP